jgi:lysozyme family protein
MAHCDAMPSRLAVLHFDGAVNHGVGRAAKFLQTAAGVAADGDIGPGTMAAVNAANELALCNSVCDQREKFYRDIVAAKPVQAKYLNGWLRRVTEMRAFVTDTSRSFS